jgi:hypothetical protein
MGASALSGDVIYYICTYLSLKEETNLDNKYMHRMGVEESLSNKFRGTNSVQPNKFRRI